MEQRLSRRQKQVIAAAIIVGGGAGVRLLRSYLRDALREQQMLCSAAGLDESSKRSRAPKVAVDAVFAKRLGKVGLLSWGGGGFRCCIIA